MLEAPIALSEEVTNGFGPLQTLLEKFSTTSPDREVRRRHPALNPRFLLTPPQESATVRIKVEVLLPPLASLNALFGTLPSDVVEQRRRDELIRYVNIAPPPHAER